jgi:hypothetical protein
MWERACSRRLFNIPHLSWLTHRFREQARSHIYSAVWQKIAFTKKATPSQESPLI